MTLEKGTTLGPYEIVARLGAGGMGEVLRARDSRLKRDVAVKILPPAFAEDPEALARFEREAQVVASISHPNILSIFDVGRHEGITYLVTELLEGETLRARMERVTFSPRKTVDLASQIVTGLAAAHERGVMHRDLKPENLFVTHDGHLKILDFGLAKQSPLLIDRESETEIVPADQTMADTIVGTLSYMAPEQLRGTQVDQRADLFAFGVILFEMLSGRRPFLADSKPELMGSILRDDPLELSEIGTEISPALQKIISRCLEKLPQERFQSARDLGFALEAISDFDSSAGSSGNSPVADARQGTSSSVAVLPFANMSSDPEQEYFCEGMAEEIIRALAQIEGLRVAARASAFQFKGGAKDIRQVGRALNVQTVVDGSVRTAGKRLRVTVQLIDVDNGYEIWTERYDREMEDVFAIQDEISESIVEALHAKLVPGKKREAAKPPTSSLEAYQLYLKGQHNWYKREKGSLQRAIQFFEGAIRLDPDYSLAHIGIANAYSSLVFYGYEPRIGGEKAGFAIERAREIDPDLPELWAAIGLKGVFVDREWADAQQALSRAIETNPNDMASHCWYSFVFGNLGQHSKAVEAARQAVDLDPLSPYALSLLGMALGGAERSEEAIEILEEAYEIDTDYLLTLWQLGGAYSAVGRHQESIAVLERAVQLSDRNAYYLGWLGWSLARAQRGEEARAILRELDHSAESEYVSAVPRVQIYGGLGDLDQAFAWLEEAIKEGSSLFSQLVSFNELRPDPRFEEARQRLGLSL